MNQNLLCHCGSQGLFSQCCAPYLSGSAKAETAEQLMRSRFSAFCTANIDYLIASHHPSKRQDDDRESLAETIAQCHWLTLKVVRRKLGLSCDNTGEVEYIATYTQATPDSQATPSQLHENSRFVREEGQWYYLDGDIFETPKEPKPGRNDPCWCGSQKKYKKCHG